MRLIKMKSTSVNDSVKDRRSALSDDNRDMRLLNDCQRLWENLRYFRERRERSLRFTYGDQWGDMIEVNGQRMTEREYTSRIGNVSLQTNQIKKLVNTMSGVWVKQRNEPVCYARDREEQSYGELMTTVLQTNWQLNKMDLLNTNLVEEAIIGGACFARECYETREGKTDAWTDICNPNYVFFDGGMKDPRFGDLSVIGEIHDITFNEFCAKFCADSDDYAKAKGWYRSESSPFNSGSYEDLTEKHDEARLEFYSPQDTSLCRVFEVWTKEVRGRWRVHDPNAGELYDIAENDKESLDYIESTNKARTQEGARLGWPLSEVPLITKEYFMQTYWYYRFLTPSGNIIMSGESPYANGSHPYSICCMPFTNGKIVSYIADAIDQNRAINRILTLHDWILRLGAKGITMVPKSIVPSDMSFQDFADQWTSMDGIVFYEPKRGAPEPRQFFGNTQQLDTTSMVQLLSSLMENGVSMTGAIQGRSPASGTSAALYAQQTNNSSTAISTFFTRFTSFIGDVCKKKLKMIQQYYDERQYRIIAGSIDDVDMSGVNMALAGDVEYDLSVKQSQETPAYRMVADDQLLEFWRSGNIPLEDYLKLSSAPYADKLLNRLLARKSTEGSQEATVPQDPIQTVPKSSQMDQSLTSQMARRSQADLIE